MKLDPVDQKALKGPHSSAKDKDINNDGKVNSSDEYLHNRRQAVSKAISKLKEEALEEKKLTAKDVKNALASAKAKPKETVSLKKPPFKMDEEAEQIDELSKKTLGSYVKKAGGTSLNSAGAHMADYGANSNQKSFKKGINRAKGVMRAADRLTKEEAEQIDEVSASTLGSYIRKASKDADASMKKRDDALDNDDGETARKMGRIARKRDKGTSMAMDKLKGTRYAKVHATEEADLDEAKKAKPGHNAMVMAKNISKVLSAVKKEEADDASTIAKHTKPLRMKLSQFRHEE